MAICVQVHAVLSGKTERKAEEKKKDGLDNLAEIEKLELKELRSRNTEQKDLLGKLLLEVLHCVMYKLSVNYSKAILKNKSDQVTQLTVFKSIRPTSACAIVLGIV